MIYIENTGGILIECPCIVPESAPTIPLYRLRTYEEEKVIHDYRPCRNPQGTEGMFDVVGRKFTPKDEFLEMVERLLMESKSISYTIGG